MRKLTNALLALVFLIGCTTARSTAREEEELRRATQRYAGLVKAMDAVAIANTYTEDGESVVVGQPALHGRKAIREQLESFHGFSVQSEMLTADTIKIDAGVGFVTGRYEQRVRIPAGNVIEVHGAYSAEWVRQGHDWYVRRLVTTPQ